jgi:3-hydroxybutyryl-CoA dehydrogenase
VSQPAENQPREGPPEGDRPGVPERIGVAGTGTIGLGLAALAAQRGGEVVVWARSETSAENARERLADGELDPAAVTVTDALERLSAATLVVEAVVEQEPAKRRLLGMLSDLLPDRCLIATTTSSLSVAELAEASGRPSRFFGFHVFNPVAVMELVELCFPSEADGETRSRAGAFCRALGKTPVEVPDEPGFVVNRLLFPYLFDAVRLLERTGMTPEEIDTCMRLGASHPMGPLELLDLVGLDVAEAIGDTLYRETGEPAHRPPGRIKRLVSERRVGRKAGEGFYTYD